MPLTSEQEPEKRRRSPLWLLGCLPLMVLLILFLVAPFARPQIQVGPVMLWAEVVEEEDLSGFLEFGH